MSNVNLRTSGLVFALTVLAACDMGGGPLPDDATTCPGIASADALTMTVSDVHVPEGTPYTLRIFSDEIIDFTATCDGEGFVAVTPESWVDGYLGRNNMVTCTNDGAATMTLPPNFAIRTPALDIAATNDETQAVRTREGDVEWVSANRCDTAFNALVAVSERVDRPRLGSSSD